MSRLAELVVSFFDLIEAEGRVLRKNVLLLCFSGVIFFVAGAFVIAAFLLVLAGIHGVLADFCGRIAAHFISAGILSATACALFVLGFRLVLGGRWHWREMRAEYRERVEEDREDEKEAWEERARENEADETDRI